MFGSILESVLNEINAEDAYNKFYSSINIDDYNNLVSAYGGKFDSIIKFILNCIKSGDCSVDEALGFISKYRDKNLPNQIRIEINNKTKSGEYENFIDIEEDLNSMLKNGVATLKTYQEEGYTVLYDDERYLLTCTTTYAANHHYYGNSKWCTASDRLGRYDGWMYFLRYTLNSNDAFDNYPDIENLTPFCILAQFVDKFKKQTYQMQVGNTGFGQICDFEDNSIDTSVFLQVFPKQLYDILWKNFDSLLNLQRTNFNKELKYQQSKDDYVEKKRAKKEEELRRLTEALVARITETRRRKFDYVKSKFEPIKGGDLFKNKDFIKQIVCFDRLVKTFNGRQSDNPEAMSDEDVRALDSMIEKQGYAYPNKIECCGSNLIIKITPVFGMVPTIELDNNERPYIKQMFWNSEYIDGQGLHLSVFVILRTSNEPDDLQKLSKSLRYDYILDESILKKLSFEQIIAVYDGETNTVTPISEDIFGETSKDENNYLIVKTVVSKDDANDLSDNEQYGGIFTPDSVIKNKIFNAKTMATFELSSYEGAFFCTLAFNRLFACRTNMAYNPVVRAFELNKDTLELIDSYYNYSVWFFYTSMVIYGTRAEDGEMVIFCDKGKIRTGINHTNTSAYESRPEKFDERFLICKPVDSDHSYIFDVKYGKMIFNGVKTYLRDDQLLISTDDGEVKNIYELIQN